MIAEDDDEASKTEEPSERKISKAKEEGDIAISQDAKSFIMLLGMLFVIWLVLPLMFKWFYMFSLKFVENPDAIPTDGRHIRLLLYNTVIALMKILGIPFAIFMVLGIFASVAQTGFVYAPKKLEPNWNKLNIFAAMTQFINMKKIVESLKGIIKITVIAFIGVLVIRPYLEKVNLMPGWRMGYCYFMDKYGLMDEVREGMMKQFRARICANVPCQAAAKASLQGPQDYIVDLNNKLKERAEFTYKRLNEIDRISTRKAKGAFYMFPKIDLQGTKWKTDKDFVLDLIAQEGVVVVHGSGFDPEFGSGHFRTITLPPMEVLEEAYDKIERFIKHNTA